MQNLRSQAMLHRFPTSRILPIHPTIMDFGLAHEGSLSTSILSASHASATLIDPSRCEVLWYGCMHPVRPVPGGYTEWC